MNSNWSNFVIDEIRFSKGAARSDSLQITETNNLKDPATFWSIGTQQTQGSAMSDATFTGAFHVFGLGYDLTAAPILPNTTEQIVCLSTDVVYNDSVGPAGEIVDHDWSHALFSLSVPFDINDNLTFTPALYYQLSMDDSVNDDDETWVGLSMTYKF